MTIHTQAQRGALSYLDDELASMREKGTYRQLRVLEGEQGAVATFDGQRVINLSSNNYLGLTSHPRLRQTALEAIERYGVGSGSVRTIAGTMALHQELEEKLAAFKHTEATLVLQSGFTANQAVINSVVGEGDAIVSDELNHASIIDGIRLNKAKRYVYRHSDMNHLEEQLKQACADGARHVLVITDGVFSMDGDIAPLPDVVRLAKQYGAITMVDDAHSSGVLGRNGRGSVDHFNLNGQIDIQVGTLSKAIGALGGYVAGPRSLREILIHRARPFLFSTSHPPSVAATCIAAIDVLQDEPQLIEKLWENVRFFKQALVQLGFNTGNSQTPITPVIAGEGRKAMRLGDRLFGEGVFAQAIGYPTVAEAKSRVRTIVTAAHTQEDLDAALAAFEKVGRELGLI